MWKFIIYVDIYADTAWTILVGIPYQIDLVDHLLDGGQLQVFHDSLEVISLSGHVYGSKQGNSFHRLKRGRPPQSRNAMEEHVKFQ